MDTIFELIILDENGKYFDCVGEYDSIEAVLESHNMYKLENPDEKYQIVKVTRKVIVGVL